MKATAQERLDALAELRAFCPPGSTVYTILRSVSRSGMSRVIDLYTIRDGEPKCIGWLTGRALDYRMATNAEGLKVSGCGMDMGFHLVNSLSYALHGIAAPEIVRCYRLASEDASADKFRPGYTLSHRWL